jgi:NAD(P)-dependent dehydrogenase (short-subunit alcohol dehydrogenase family)
MSKSVMDLFSLRGKVGLVIGGAQNLGVEMALGLAEAGSTVAITSRKADKAVTAAHALAQSTGMKIEGIGCNALDEESVHACFIEVKKQFGRLDILINNAGGTVYTGGGFQFADRRTEDFNATLNLNLKTMFFCCREAVRIMTVQKSGSIINIASMSGVVGRERSVYPETMRPNMQDYSLAKGGVIAFTRDLAAEVGQYGIRVNAISPGGFARPDHNPEFVRRYSKQAMLGRMGTDGLDLKGAAVYLASEAASYVTGHNLVVDGGFSAW